MIMTPAFYYTNWYPNSIVSFLVILTIGVRISKMADFLVRACKDRNINKKSLCTEKHKEKLWTCERLIGFLNRLDRDVDIVVKKKPTRRKTHGRLKVATA